MAKKTFDNSIKWWDILFPPTLLLKLLKILLSPKKATSIAILGMKGSGKSTLWKGLGGVKDVKINTKYERIPSFTLVRDDGSTVVINETRDIGGEDSYVKYYSELITPNCFVYYVADATRIQEYQYYRRIRSDLRKIDDVLKKKSITPDQFGFKILLSHYDEFMMVEPECSKEELYQVFFDKLATIKSTGYVGGLVRSRNNAILQAIILTTESDISLIKNEIGKN